MVKKKTALISCAVVVAVILVLAIVFISLYFTVFKPRSPQVVATVVGSRISNVSIFPPSFNLSYDVYVKVKNPNFAAFQHDAVVTDVTYHGIAVGQSVVPEGELGARATQTVGTTVDVDVVKVILTLYFPGEFLAGKMPFETTTTVKGKAVVLGTLKIKATSVVTCNIMTDPVKGESTSVCTSEVHVG